MDWRKFIGSLSETPVRSRSPATPPPSPASPAQATGQPTPLRIIKPQDVNVQKFAGRMARILGIASASALDGYLSDLIACLAMNEFGVEDYGPEDAVFWGSNQQAAGGAGNFGRIGLVNPVGSNVIGVVSYMAGYTGAASDILVSYDGVVFPGAQFNANSRDSRYLGVGVNAGGNRIRLDGDNTQGVIGATSVQRKPAGPAQVAEWTGNGEKGIAVISPGHSLVLAAATANTVLSAEFRWRERALLG